MSVPPIANKIRERGHYRVNFRPLHLPEAKLSLEQCRAVVEKNRTQLRGWDYPHFPSRQGNDSRLGLGENYCEGWIDWSNYKELWRVFQSSQFLHLAALREDWPEDALWGGERRQKPGEVLNVIGSLFYVVGEIFEFLARLLRGGLYPRGAQVSVTLAGTEGRTLVMEPESGRAPLYDGYTCTIPRLTFETAVVDAGACPAAALEAAEYFVHRFGWLRPSPDVLRELVVDYMSGGRRR